MGAQPDNGFCPFWEFRQSTDARCDNDAEWFHLGGHGSTFSSFHFFFPIVNSAFNLMVRPKESIKI